MDKTTYNYNFPPYRIDSDTDIDAQIAKIEEEAQEVDDAADLTQVAIECMDVIVACETLLHMLPDGYTNAAKQMVHAKIAGRSKWKEDAAEQTADAEPLHPRPPAFFYSKTTLPSWAK